MKKILIGGSPCTHWSVIQNAKNREVQASGQGWELFKNFVIALEKFKPDYFIYENNSSIHQDIKKTDRKGIAGQSFGDRFSTRICTEKKKDIRNQHRGGENSGGQRDSTARHSRIRGNGEKKIKDSPCRR